MSELTTSNKRSTEYENYSKTSSQYDDTRVEVGIDFMAKAFASVGPMDELQLLDAGCGTGSYIDAFRDRVQGVVGVDLNQGMLDQAEHKFQDDPSVTLKQGSLVEIPCEDDQFDAAMCNQVIHHLANGEGEDRFSGIQELANEVYRVLRPGAVFVLNLSTPEQSVDGFWWASLIPDAVEVMTKRCPDVSELHEMLSNAGFTICQTTALKDEVLQGDNYLDLRGPLKSEWRDGDSTWSLASESELSTAMKSVEEMNGDGKMQSYIDDREERRRQVGQTTSIFASKPSVGQG
jgi:ubiquinone/menaquinone biosynthesis C-methylase UbiE